MANSRKNYIVRVFAALRTGQAPSLSMGISLPYSTTNSKPESGKAGNDRRVLGAEGYKPAFQAVRLQAE